MITAFLGMGANLGNRAETLQRAVQILHDTSGVEVTGVSSLYETPPVGVLEQPDFLNAVLQIETDLSARDLLTLLLDIEQQFGRVRIKKWGPRILDLDILLYGDRVIEEDGLWVPHPHLPARAFVLQPLCDLCPERVHPVLKQTFSSLLDVVSGRESLKRVPISLLMK